MKRITNIDKLRGAACLLIVFYHCYAVTGVMPVKVSVISNLIASGGTIGVIVFFVLSGYGIYHSLNRSLEKGQLSYAGFMKGRIVRIVPQYYFNIVVLLLLSSSAVYLQKNYIMDIVAHLLFLHSLSLAWHGTINGALWTMAIIFQFYVIAVPLFLLIKRFEKHKIIIGILAAVVTVSMKYLMLNYLWVVDRDKYGYFAVMIPGMQLITSLDTFIYGMLAASFSINTEEKKGRRYIKTGAILGALVALVLLAYCISHYSETDFGCYCQNSLVGLAVMLLIYGLSFGTKDRGIISRMLLYIGKHEYGIYLWHLPILCNLVDNSPLIRVCVDRALGGWWGYRMFLYVLLNAAVLLIEIFIDCLFEPLTAKLKVCILSRH